MVLLISSCSSSRRASKSVGAAGSTSDYVTAYLNKYSTLAVSEMKRTGIPASITLAQGMLESNYGRSTLAVRGNNHFGIKCHSDWQGDRVLHDDNRRGECFRAYSSAEDSYRDHSDFLVNGSRYRDLFRLSSTDYKGWAHGLRKAGYATDPNYAHLLITKIEQYGLHAYDTGSKMPVQSARQATGGPANVTASKAAASVSPSTTSSPPSSVPARVPPAVSGTDQRTVSAAVQKDADTAVTEKVPSSVPTAGEAEAPIKVITLGSSGKLLKNNDVEYIIADEGDTWESVAEKHQLLAWEITRYNDIAPGTPLQPGQVIYLQPKRTRASQGLAVHTVTPGETMYSISQKYAIRLSSLYKMNVMTEGSECKPGQKLRIR